MILQSCKPLLNVYNWIVNFETDRQHHAEAKGSRSKLILQALYKDPAWTQWLKSFASEVTTLWRYINQFIIIIINASDLRPIHQYNMVFKYAVDTDLIVPDIFSLTIPQELQHISDWAKNHNLKLNQTKSLEIINSLQTSQYQYISQELIP